MPTLKEAQDKVRELGKKGLDLTQDHTMPAGELKTALDKVDADLKHWLTEVESLEHVEERRKAFLAASGQPVEEVASDVDLSRLSAGEQFVQSENYKSLIGRGLKGNWSSGDVELKTTLTEGTTASPGPGNAPVATPVVLPGVVDIQFRPLLVSDLFPAGTTESPLIRYLVETAVTNAAAATAEGGLKPESALTFAKVDEVLHKIATFLPISDEMLEDWAQAQSYVNARLGLFVRLAEEAQLLTGDGTGSNLVGLLNRSGLAPAIPKGGASGPPVIPASDNAMDAIFRQITAIRTTAFLEPDGIVVDPVTWQNITLAKTTQGVYYANGPFASQQPATLWGKRVVVTPAMASGTALVGAFGQGAQLFRKGGITVVASNSHADFFQRDLTAIRAEERLALAVYRPSAFGTVTGL